MITIKFPKSPKSIQRKRIQDIGRKHNYSEDSFFSIIEIEEFNQDFATILNSIRWWKSLSILIDGEEIDIHKLYMITKAIQNKSNEEDFGWYNLAIFRCHNFLELKENIEIWTKEGLDGENYRNRWLFEELVENGIIKTILKDKEYSIEKEGLKEIVLEEGLTINKIYPNFDYKKVLVIIDSLPDKLTIPKIDNSNLGEENEEPEGEEWIDWYSPTKWHLKVLELLKKIEKNTRR